MKRRHFLVALAALALPWKARAHRCRTEIEGNGIVCRECVKHIK